MQVFSPRQSPNEFVFALGLSKTFIFMQVFSPRQSPNEFVFALGLSKTFIFMHLFSPRQSPNEFVFVLNLSKTVIFGFIAAKIVQAAGNAKFRAFPGPACSAYGGWGRILSVFGFLSLFDRNMAVIGFPVGLAGSVRSNPENSVTFALHKLFAGVRPGHVAEVCMFVAADN